MHRSLILAIIILIVIPVTYPATAQEKSSPYIGMESRPIKALSDTQIADLKAGHGMGLALAAELNGYPGPKHVLELADQLHLTSEQRTKTEALYKTMKTEAMALGNDVIRLEGDLDRLFTEQKATPKNIHQILMDIGQKQAELRYAHLKSHLATVAVLTSKQIATYNKKRGYNHNHSASYGEQHKQHRNLHSAHEASNTLKASSSITATVQDFNTLKPDQVNTLTIKLTNPDNTPLTLDKLQEVHTKKIHFLVVDETLRDYHHLHPEAGKEPGTYVTSFTPKNSGTYKLWADVTPINEEQQFGAITLDGTKPCVAPCVEKVTASEATTSGLKAHLSFEKPPKVGEANMGTVKITDETGKPVTDLEPVMGAFGHIVAFYEDFETVAHVHPIGQESTSDADRGDPNLQFHLEPEKSGFLKLFVQIKRNGKDIFIPFGASIFQP